MIRRRSRALSSPASGHRRPDARRVRGQKTAGPAAKDTIVFSILSTESAQNMESYWKPILADMEKFRPA
jgi:ABC-type phosphate/phosphonate transport system substrate-binding protein